jgi:hypothetical protein
MSQPCPTCRDSDGVVYESTGAHPCHACAGSGVVPRRTGRDTLRLLACLARVRWSRKLPRRRQESD